jgi:uncharacterized phage protein (TIGR01671 family)
MRTIKFRFKLKKDIEGEFEILTLKTFWSWGSPDEIAWETVGEYTGLKDRNGKEIYEGDFLFNIKGIDDISDNYYIVEWINGAFRHTGEGGMPTGDWTLRNYEVRGNIHDNPELL